MRRSHWPAALALLTLIVLVVLLWRGCSGRPGGGEAAAGGVRLESPDLELKLLEVKATPRGGYIDWACIFECAERGGCRADVELEVSYRVATAAERRLTMAGRMDADRGERMRIGRAQRPAVEGIRVESVTVRVRAPYRPDAPPPTPIL